MAEPAQNYKNHLRWLPPFHFFVLPVLLLNVCNHIRLLVRTPTLGDAWAVVVALALLGLAFVSRVQANTVQDRVIRLEMRLRLARLLPADLQSRINELTVEQLCGLRFASDAELPDITRRVFTDNIAKRTPIKKMIKNWEADWLRA
jgi:hypothetical protein